VNLRALIADAAATLERRKRKRIDLSPPWTETGRVHRRKVVRRAIENLLGNALKYRQRQDVSVAMRTTRARWRSRSLIEALAFRAISSKDVPEIRFGRAKKRRTAKGFGSGSTW